MNTIGVFDEVTNVEFTKMAYFEGINSELLGRVINSIGGMKNMETQKIVIDLKHFISELRNFYIAQGGDLETFEKEAFIDILLYNYLVLM